MNISSSRSHSISAYILDKVLVSVTLNTFCRKEFKMYKEKDLTKLSFIILLTLKFCLGWKLPPAKFLSQFSEENDRTQISVSLPVGMELPLLNRYFRQLTRFVQISIALN